MDISLEEHRNWHAHQQTPVLFNHHEPYYVTSRTINAIDLNPINATRNPIENKERVLILTPLRDAAEHLQRHIDLLYDLTYPHELIDLGFLVGDTIDETLAVLAAELNRFQNGKHPFNSATVVRKDFGAQVSQHVEERHDFAAQGPRRRVMGRARNYLLSATLKPEHSWVYWRDVDVIESPATILQDFMKHDKDVVVPSTFWRVVLTSLW